LKGAAYRSFQPLLLNALTVPAMGYIIHRLGAVGYGEWTAATSLVATTSALTSLGLRGPFVRRIAREPDFAAEALREQLGTRTVLASVAGAVTVLIAMCLGYSGTVVLCTGIAAAGAVLTAVATTGSDLLEAFQRLPTVAIASMAAGLILTAASVLVAWAAPGAAFLSASYLLGPLTMVLVIAWYVRRANVPIRFHAELRRGLYLLWSGRHFAVQQLVFAASSNLALLMLPKLIGTTTFGLFSAGTLLVTRLVVFPDAIVTAFFPLISKSVTVSPRMLRQRVLFGFLLILVLCAGVALSVSMAAGIIAHILFPRTAEQCRWIISITMWALPLVGVEMMAGCAINAVGREAAQARLSMIGAALSLGLGAFLIGRWHITGACWFVVLRPAIQTSLLLPEFLRVLCRPDGRHSALHLGGEDVSHALPVAAPMGAACQTS
jgi:O-antigen/teichoic acid export membrane protein